MWSNQAAWLNTKSSRRMNIEPAPYTKPYEGEMVIKNGAVAINPIDGFKQLVGDRLFSWIKYPFIMGGDVAGEVIEVGKTVTRFKVGDRVMGHAVGMEKTINKSSQSAFQQYTVIRVDMASQIPRAMSYESACVLPLCLSTAACGLFQESYLALPYPSLSPKLNGKTLLVWGGSTTVGSNAIQLAAAAGCEVITTASPKNFDYVRRLGAVTVFDYRSTTVVKDVIEAFRNRECAGAFAVGNGSIKACIEILAASRGSKLIAQISVELPDRMPTSTLGWMLTGISMGWFSMSVSLKSKVKGVDIRFVSGGDIVATELSHAIYEDYMPAALAEGKYIAAPEPLVVGKGLEYVQEGIDINLRGVSAKKVVVSL
ncbi:hypothetical protein LTR62_001353 [Meristemomyces frigidus]|uniref:Enoyl reductase (ER) domain-containing protein n=1 Tax=Meristemomyces frigidus TaxID=1508187 RepID=A0AAN7YBM7_9PEZI|nr:hypothetical protein LTR62_001353 [Meristemomyces frigidus]